MTPSTAGHLRPTARSSPPGCGLTCCTNKKLELDPMFLSHLLNFGRASRCRPNARSSPPGCDWTCCMKFHVGFGEPIAVAIGAKSPACVGHCKWTTGGSRGQHRPGTKRGRYNTWEMSRYNTYVCQLAKEHKAAAGACRCRGNSWLPQHCSVMAYVMRSERM